MSDPTKSSDEARASEALREQTDVARQLDPAWMEQRHEDAYLAAEPEQLLAPRERLFSRKVLFGWAFAALLFVFIIRMVLPVVFDTVKESVITSMKESVHNTSGAVVAPTPPIPPVPPVPEVKISPAPAAPVVAPSAGTHSTTVQTPETKSRR